MKKTYKKMLKLMAQKPSVNSKIDKWFLYILQCQDQTFYTGITKDLQRRLKMHNQGKASKYTRVRRPVTMIYMEKCAGRTAAMVRECQVKAMPRIRKERLIKAVLLKKGAD